VLPRYIHVIIFNLNRTIHIQRMPQRRVHYPGCLGFSPRRDPSRQVEFHRSPCSQTALVPPCVGNVLSSPERCSIGPFRIRFGIPGSVLRVETMPPWWNKVLRPPLYLAIKRSSDGDGVVRLGSAGFGDRVRALNLARSCTGVVWRSLLAAAHHRRVVDGLVYA
jgi:hypothetical protein